MISDVTAEGFKIYWTEMNGFYIFFSQVARNNAVKGKQKNTISFLYNFKHCNLVAKQS